MLLPVARGLVAGSAHAQIARSERCATSTVTRLSARIGRHCVLFQQLARDQLGPPSETIAFDHFETFVFSQLDRLGIATPVGHRTRFIYGFEAAPHRGNPRRAARKKPVKGPVTEPPPRSVVRSTIDALAPLISPDTKLELLTDEHSAYRPAVAKFLTKIRHTAYANPQRGPGADAELAKARDHALSPVDALHKLLQHSQAHHRRETIAFGRRANGVMERAATFVVWRNFIKRCTERRSGGASPAMQVGIARERWRWRWIFSHRLFPERVGLTNSWQTIYRRELITPAVGRNLPHRLVNAY